jgi:hypothetical protein
MFKTFELVSDASAFISGGQSWLSFSPLESLLILLIEPRYIHNIIYVIRIGPVFLSMITMLTTFVFIFALFGSFIFKSLSQESLLYFNGVFNAFWNMLMTLNASNWPDPVLPAYIENSLYILFFFSFVMIGNWGLTNIILGYFFAIFNVEEVKIHEKCRQVWMENMQKAFELLDSEHRGYCTYTEVEQLLKELYLQYQTQYTPPSLAGSLYLCSNHIQFYRHYSFHFNHYIEAAYVLLLYLPALLFCSYDSHHI